MEKHIHVTTSIGVGASIATDYEEWLKGKAPCLLCNAFFPSFHGAALVEMRPELDQEIVHDRLTFKQAQMIVGGFVEPIFLLGGSTLSMLVNEDGGLANLPVNYLASKLYGGIIYGTVIVGTGLEIDRVLSS